MLAVHPLAVYKNFEEARFYCILRENCTGISSWPDKHFLVTGMEMVSGVRHHVFHLKTGKDQFCFYSCLVHWNAE